MKNKKFILPFEEVGIRDVGLVGGKNASLGEMLSKLSPKGVRIPGGFIVTAEAYRYFLKSKIKNQKSKIQFKIQNLEEFIKQTLKRLDTKNLKDLATRGKLIREAIKNVEFPKDLEEEIIKAYQRMEKEYGKNVDVAVRSSATAEDLPGASFAGEHETYLGIRGTEDLLSAIRAAMASLFTDRAISYRVDKGFDHFKVALSVGVEKMVRADTGAAGVIFTLDTESGFPNVVLINGSWGLGEMIVKGQVTPDEFLVWKEGLKKDVVNPIIDKHLGVKERKMIYSQVGRGIKQTKIVPTKKTEKENFILNDKEILILARWAVMVEEHYSKKNGHFTPMDLEWARDGRTHELFIIQARPETVHAGRDFSKIKEYKLLDKREPVAIGASVGSSIAEGKARVILDAKSINTFKKGEVLITDMTDPDWEPIMKIASAIVTDKGGRTSHAAIVSRELGIPAVVGTEKATRVIKTGEFVTVDTTGSEGNVYKGKLRFKVLEHDLKKIPKPKTKIMINVAIPETAFEISYLPNSGVGLAREEFIIASKIGIHPNLILDFEKIKKRNFQFLLRPRAQDRGAISNFQTNPKSESSKYLKRTIKEVEKRTAGWEDKTQFYVDNLVYGIAKIGTAFYPRPVIVRFSDFKTNEYRTLLGGEAYEPKEENPMIGWRGASRYYDPGFKQAFKLECLAIKRARDEIGLKNVIPMVPFCRTVDEGIKTMEIMAETGLITKYIARKKNLKIKNITPIYVMCEIPSNVLLADEFLKVFDGMSIGSNDLTQLTLGLDRDSGVVNKVANENDASVKFLIAEVIKKCRNKKKYIGICGQAPSDYPDFAKFLVSKGIESISLNPDTVVKTTVAIAAEEKKERK